MNYKLTDKLTYVLNHCGCSMADLAAILDTDITTLESIRAGDDELRYLLYQNICDVYKMVYSRFK